MNDKLLQKRNKVQLYAFRLIAMILMACFITFFFHRSSRFFEVVEGLIYRSAQLNADKLDTVIKSNGIKTVVNLRGEQIGEKWFTQEQSICDRNEVLLLNFDIKTTYLPINHIIRDLVIALKKAKRPILIHCYEGIDSTGFVSGLALAMDQDPPLSTIEKQLSYQFGLIPVYRSVGVPIFSAYKKWLKTNSMDHSGENLSNWLLTEYAQNFTSVQYALDRINNTLFKNTLLNLKSTSDKFTLYGWAFNISTKEKPKHFRVFIDQKPLPPVSFTRNRPDVAQFYRLGQPFEKTFMVGWETTIPKNRLSKGKHWLSLEMGTSKESTITIHDLFIIRVF